MNTLNRHTQIADLGSVVHRLVRRGLGVFFTLLVLGLAVLFFSGNPGWAGLLWMGVGTLIAFAVWQGKAIGLPLVPLFALQHFVTYGTPIIARNDTLDPYPPSFLTHAGIEICIFLVALAGAWRLGMEFFRPGTTYAYALKLFDNDSSQSRVRAGLFLVLATTAYNILNSLQLVAQVMDMLPGGTYPLVTALVKATTMAGYFLLAMLVGSRDTSPTVTAIFWVTLATNALIVASSFLLSAATNLFAAVIIGLFWGSGRIPWRFLTVIAVLLSFLHLGKFDMRDRYWAAEEDRDDKVTTLLDLPAHYAEWMHASYRNLTGAGAPPVTFGRQEDDTDSMLDRVNNLQNLLFAIDAVDTKKIPTLDGATYTLIPPLLIPRVLWPDKPRAHEGQALLNVHFGRQTLSATFKTYIAWGLLPEAYGNFGRIWGSVILGGVLGLIFAWIENATARKPLLSLEGLVTFAFFTGLAVSFEMVASVLITSLFQTLVIITMACLPFVQRMRVERPDEEQEHDDPGEVSP